MVKSVGNDEPIKINGQFVPHRRRIRPVHDDFESMLRGGYIRKYNTDHTGWESPHMLDLDPTGIPTPRWARAAMFQAGTDPAVAQSDFDNDGLGIATERGDVIGAWACFHIPDIFVEVDWMEGHEMSNEAVAKVLWAFARHGIALHIDRGEMGGGNEITYDDSLTDEEWYGWEDRLDPTDIDNDDNTNEPDGMDDDGDLWSLASNEHIYGRHFTDARFGIFHYCVFIHDTAESADGCSIGNTFVICDWNMNPRVNDQTQTFLHELGHGILDELDANHQSTASGDSTPRYHCRNDCAMFWSGSLKDDYCSEAGLNC